MFFRVLVEFFSFAIWFLRDKPISFIYRRSWGDLEKEYRHPHERKCVRRRREIAGWLFIPREFWLSGEAWACPLSQDFFSFFVDSVTFLLSHELGRKKDAFCSVRVLSDSFQVWGPTHSLLALFLGTTCLLCASVIMTKTFCGNLQQPLLGFVGSTCIVCSVVQEQEC